MRRGDFLIVGEIRKPHGIKGECFVVPATDDVAGVYATGRVLRVADPEGEPEEGEPTLTVAGARPFKGGLIVRFEDVSDRNAAEALRGRTLVIPRSEARPLDEGEYFLHDLAGLEVRSVEGRLIGRVSQVYEGGAGHILGVDDGERERLIPFTREVVREVDVEGGRIVIEPVRGLLDL